MIRKITKIVIHCSDSPDDKDFNVDDIRQWHKKRGWNDVGYHFVITRSGELQLGRDIEIIGAHTRGYNSNSIGICWVGSKLISLEAYSTLVQICLKLLDKYNLSCENILGHSELNPHKTCPNLNMEKFREHLADMRFLNV